MGKGAGFLLIPIDQSRAIKDISNRIDDLKLRRSARRREKASNDKDYIPIEKAYKNIIGNAVGMVRKLQHRSVKSGKYMMPASEIDREIKTVRRLKENG